MKLLPCLLLVASCSLGLKKHSYGSGRHAAYEDKRLVSKSDTLMTYYYHKQNRFSCFQDGKWHGRIYTIQASNISYALMFFYDLDSTYDVTKIEAGDKYVIHKERTEIPSNIEYEIAYCYLNYPRYGLDGLFFTDTYLFASVRFP
jgi:hypothetical protein